MSPEYHAVVVPAAAEGRIEEEGGIGVEHPGIVEEILAKEGVYPKLGVWPRRVLLSQIGSELIQRRVDPLPREYLAKI
ncbi:MAG: hypothetical protein JZU63_07060, partial [Rhodoferax sp.]|nr:hypothetical protein [Rhodoferax sp.]